MLRLAQQRIDVVDARVLLQHVLCVDRAYLVAHDRDVMAMADAALYQALVERRAAGEPVAYLTGSREFYGLLFHVSPDVLIPRPETEMLVDLALEKLAATTAPRVLDMGTGSGAIAIAIAALRADACVTAIDASVHALALAHTNAQQLLGGAAARVTFIRSDWYAMLDAGARFDVVVTNPPYVARDDAHLQRGDLRFEPITALVGGSSGMEAIEHIVANSPRFLVPGGWLLTEHGYDQGERCRHCLQQAGFSAITTKRDLASIERVTFGRLS